MGPPTWLVVDAVSEWFMLVLLAFKLTAGFAVLNVIMSVFVRQTAKCADTIDEFTIKERAKARVQFCSRLEHLFEALDVSGDGLLSRDEFEKLLHIPEISAWLNLLEISTADVNELFEAVDDGDGEIEVHEFVGGFKRMQGSATAVDAVSLRNRITKVDHMLETI